MVQCHKQPFGWIFVSRMIGIICFLIVVVLAKILSTFLAPECMLLKVINGILFANFWLILVIAIILFVADIFGSFQFPLNLPSPIIRAFGSIFCIAFVISVFQWIDSTFATTLVDLFWYPSLILIPFLFLLVIASGYYEIMQKLWWPPKTTSDPYGQIVHQETVDSDMPPDTKSWEELGAEFRLVLYDLLQRFRQEIKRK